jgi:hypothetical protein
MLGTACGGDQPEVRPPVQTSKVEVVKQPAAPPPAPAKQRKPLTADQLLPDPPPAHTVTNDRFDCKGDCGKALARLIGSEHQRANLVVPARERAAALADFQRLCDGGDQAACRATQMIEEVADLPGGEARFRYRFAMASQDGTVLAEEVLCDLDDNTWLQPEQVVFSANFFTERLRGECGAGGYRQIPDGVRPARLRVTLSFGGSVGVMDVQGSTDEAVRDCVIGTARRTKHFIAGICRLTIPIP